MKTNTDNSPMLPSLPWHIRFDKEDIPSARKGWLIHVEQPKFKCQFHIGIKPIETKGFSTYNPKTGVLLYGVKLPENQNLASNISAISESMKEGSRVLYDMLYLPALREN